MIWSGSIGNTHISTSNRVFQNKVIQTKFKRINQTWYNFYTNIYTFFKEYVKFVELVCNFKVPLSDIHDDLK